MQPDQSQDSPTGYALTARDAALTGGRAAMQVWREGTLGVTTKAAPNDLVTAADRAAEQVIVELIRSRHPDDAILAEESGEHAGSSGRRWLVDPVDGTTNFVHGRADVAVSVGLERGNEIVAGAVHRPRFGDWLAAVGGRTWASGEPPELSDTNRLADALVSIGVVNRPHMRERGFRLLADLLPHLRDYRRTGSAACDLYSVATGTLDAYLGIGVSPWDVAGGQAVVQALGGTCRHLRLWGDVPSFLGGNPVIADEVERLLAEHDTGLHVVVGPSC